MLRAATTRFLALHSSPHIKLRYTLPRFRCKRNRHTEKGWTQSAGTAPPSTSDATGDTLQIRGIVRLERVSIRRQKHVGLALASVAVASYALLSCGRVRTKGAATTEPANQPKNAAPDVPISTPSSPWPPPFLLYFSAFVEPTLGIEVDDRYVYFYQSPQRFMRADKSGVGEPTLLIQCGTCDPYKFVADAGSLYFLAGEEVARVDRETGEKTAFPLNWDHDLGGILVDEHYVYTVMPGCAAITRIDKQTLTKDVIRIPGATFPTTAGMTRLAKAGSKLLCGTPSQLYVLDEWTAPPRQIYTQVLQLWGLVGFPDRAYWLEAKDAPNTIASISVDGGTVTRVSEPFQRPKTMQLLFAPGIGKLIYGTSDGLQTYDLATEKLGRFVNVGYVLDLAADSEFVYATVESWRSHLVDGIVKTESASWIVRVPLSDLN